MKDYHDQERSGTLDRRDPVAIAGDDGKYVDMEIANAKRSGSLSGLKKRIGSLRKKRHDD